MDAAGVKRLEVTVIEGGKQKLWTIDLKGKDGNLHYLVQTLKDYNEGDEVIVEMKNANGRNFVQVRKVGEIKAGDEIPVIDLNEGLGDAGKDEFDTEIPF